MAENPEEESARLQAIVRRAADGAALTDSDLRELAAARRRYPYAGVFGLLALLHDGSLSADERREVQKRLAMSADDPRTFDTVRGADWLQFYPPAPEPSTARTDTDRAIDLFLNTYGHSSPEEDALLERMIFNPAPDYAEVLAREEQENLPEQPVEPDTPQGRIDSFILANHPAARHEPAPEPPAPEEKPAPIAKPGHEAESALLSESLARVFIHQGRYERAFEIISSLNLKFPKKSAYFADQLRFLQKLIINQNLKNKK